VLIERFIRKQLRLNAHRVSKVESGEENMIITIDRLGNRCPDETYDLRWLGDHALVFDRVADDLFLNKSRIWKVDVPR
jgi:hypothetical protein